MVPAGFVLTPKGGRPSKLARDAAVFLAIHWRKQMGDTPGLAEAWVLDTWRSAYTGGWLRDGMSAEVAHAMREVWKKYGGGMTEAAHVRSSAMRARRAGLNSALMVNSESFAAAIEVPRPAETSTTIRLNLSNGQRCWYWRPGLPLAAYGPVSGVQVEVSNEFEPTPLSVASRAVFERG